MLFDMLWTVQGVCIGLLKMTQDLEVTYILLEQQPESKGAVLRLLKQ